MSVMRAKMKIVEVKEYRMLADESVVTSEDLQMTAVCASQFPKDGSDENNSYAKWTPSADLTMAITNPALFGKFTKGQEFYVDFTPCVDGK